MKDSTQSYFGRFWRLSLLLIPAILCLAPTIYYELVNWADILLSTLGTTFIVIYGLGVTIDWWLKKAIVDDVVEASLGYILPEELKPAMRWLYNQRIICVHHDQSVTIEKHPENKDLAIVTVKMLREFENRGKNTEQVGVGITIDEWLVDGYESKVLEYGYVIGDEEVMLHENIEKQTCNLTIRNRIVNLKPNDRLTIWHTAQETKRINDAMFSFYTNPTVKPIIKYKADKGICVRINFSTDEHIRANQELGEGRVRLNSTLLPSQPIEIRWWDEQASHRWRYGNESKDL